MSNDKPREEANETIASRPMRQDQAGESGGGAYSRGDVEHKEFKGGQSDHAYYGEGQLGEEKLDENENAPSAED